MNEATYTANTAGILWTGNLAQPSSIFLIGDLGAATVSIFIRPLVGNTPVTPPAGSTYPKRDFTSSSANPTFNYVPQGNTLYQIGISISGADGSTNFKAAYPSANAVAADS